MCNSTRTNTETSDSVYDMVHTTFRDLDPRSGLVLTLLILCTAGVVSFMMLLNVHDLQPARDGEALGTSAHVHADTRVVVCKQ